MSHVLYIYTTIVLHIAPGRHCRRSDDLWSHLRHARGIRATRISTPCALSAFETRRMSGEKSQTIVRTPSTLTVRGGGVKAQASNRSSTPPSPPGRPRRTTPGRRLCCRPNNSSKPPETHGKHGVGFRSDLQGSGAGRLERRQDLHRASLLRRTVLRHLHLDDR